MQDGIRLSATLYVPGGEGSPWPAIVEALPYRKDDVTASSRPEYVRLADAGYVVCRVDVRGTGSSEGIATDEYPAVSLRSFDVQTVFPVILSSFTMPAPGPPGLTITCGPSTSGDSLISQGICRPLKSRRMLRCKISVPSWIRRQAS